MARKSIRTKEKMKDTMLHSVSGYVKEVIEKNDSLERSDII